MSPPPADTGTQTRSLSLSNPWHTSSCISGGPDFLEGLGSWCWWQSLELIPDPKSNRQEKEC